MTARRLVIIENGGANLASLRFALERLECEAMPTADPGAIRKATHVILPGVGAAPDAMRRLRERGLDTLIPQLTQPLLGICLGMQLLYESSDEGEATCLGIIPGRARKLIPAPGRPVPHMGWNQLNLNGKSELLRDLAADDRAYFVHSYALPVGPQTAATCEYGGAFSAVVAHRNFMGVQFHPERSGRLGATVLRNFLELDR